MEGPDDRTVALCGHHADVRILNAGDVSICFCERCRRGYAAPALPLHALTP